MEGTGDPESGNRGAGEPQGEGQERWVALGVTSRVNRSGSNNTDLHRGRSE